MVKNNQNEDKEQQKEVGLFDLVIVLLKHKWMILSIVLLTLITSAAYIKLYGAKKASTEAVNLYYSDCVIESDLVPIDSIKAILLSRTLTTSMAEANKLKQIRLEMWEKKENRWITVQTKPVEEAGSFPTIRIKETKNTLTLSALWISKDLPQKLLNDYLQRISEYFRKRDRENYESKIHLKIKRPEAIVIMTPQQTGIRSGSYYGFNVIDPPSDPIAAPLSKPNYVMIILLLMLASLIIAVSLAYIIEYINNMRIREPEKYNLVKKYLRLNYRRR